MTKTTWIVSVFFACVFAVAFWVGPQPELKPQIYTCRARAVVEHFVGELANRKAIYDGTIWTAEQRDEIVNTIMDNMKREGTYEFVE